MNKEQFKRIIREEVKHVLSEMNQPALQEFEDLVSMIERDLGRNDGYNVNRGTAEVEFREGNFITFFTFRPDQRKNQIEVFVTGPGILEKVERINVRDLQNFASPRLADELIDTRLDMITDLEDQLNDMRRR